MKKIPLILVAAIISFTICNQVLVAGSKAIALALKVNGDVKLTRAGSTTQLKFGTTLNDSDIIRTGEDGFITIMFTDDKSLLKVIKHTEITLQGDRDASGYIAKQVSIEIGDLFAKVKQQLGSLELMTPTAVARVKGTGFWIGIDNEGNSYVTTIEGIVELISLLDGRIIEIRAAQRCEVDNQGNMVFIDIEPDSLAGDPDPDLEDDIDTKIIEIRFLDEDGNERTIEIQYREQDE